MYRITETVDKHICHLVLQTKSLYLLNYHQTRDSKRGPLSFSNPFVPTQSEATEFWSFLPAILGLGTCPFPSQLSLPWGSGQWRQQHAHHLVNILQQVSYHTRNTVMKQTPGGSSELSLKTSTWEFHSIGIFSKL